ncbi:unnamed protein product [Leuciscus chuanchicus]
MTPDYKCKLNVLSEQLLGFSMVQDYTSLGEYTGELIGVENLYFKSSRALEPSHQHTAALQPPGLSSSEIGPAESSLPETATHSHSEPGGECGTRWPSWISSSYQGFVTQDKVDEIVALWDSLSEHVKGPLIYPPHHHDKSAEGHNARKKRQEKEVLQQYVQPFSVPLVASEHLPPMLSKLKQPVQHVHSAFVFAINEDASGLARPHV